VGNVGLLGGYGLGKIRNKQGTFHKQLPSSRISWTLYTKWASVF